MPFARPTLLFVLAIAACRVEDGRRLAADSVAAVRKANTIANAPKPAGTAAGFREPASARYDPALDVVFVSNVDGAPGAKDGNGFISRVRPDGTVDSLRVIAGGRGGAKLDAPKGLAITGDTLWAADIDAVRAFDARTGAPLATVDLKPLGAAFLSGIAVGPDGALYVTDAGPGGRSDAAHGNRIFRIGAGRRASVAVHSDSLGAPSGITWDARGNRFIIVQWGGARILAWRPGDAQPRTIGFGAKQMDGVQLLADGRLIVSSRAEHAIMIRFAAEEYTVKGFSAPGDFGVDTRRQRLAIPIADKNTVEFWDIPPFTPPATP